MGRRPVVTEVPLNIAAVQAKQGELSEKNSQNLFHNLTPQTVFCKRKGGTEGGAIRRGSKQHCIVHTTRLLPAGFT